MFRILDFHTSEFGCWYSYPARWAARSTSDPELQDVLDTFPNLRRLDGLNNVDLLARKQAGLISSYQPSHVLHVHLDLSPESAFQYAVTFGNENSVDTFEEIGRKGAGGNAVYHFNAHGLPPEGTSRKMKMCRITTLFLSMSDVEAIVRGNCPCSEVCTHFGTARKTAINDIQGNSSCPDPTVLAAWQRRYNQRVHSPIVGALLF